MRIVNRPHFPFLFILLLVSPLEMALGESEQIASGAEEDRKMDVTLKIYDDEGNPLSGASIEYIQYSHDFLIGLGAPCYDPYTASLLKAGGINYMELFLSWKATSDPNYFNCLKPHGYHAQSFKLTGHCLVWMVGSYPEKPHADPYNLPEHVKRLKYNELKTELRSHLLQTVSQYKDWITYWTINEPFWRYADPFHLTNEQWIEICEISVKTIKEVHPEGKI
ncbi:hypothetical protein KEJ44_07090, partial [Candidatus Bathyarchaeota archaeon]|nr:hypothetical protein [Candidatus Bathyarchaeota archaeon]